MKKIRLINFACTCIVIGGKSCADMENSTEYLSQEALLEKAKLTTECIKKKTYHHKPRSIL